MNIFIFLFIPKPALMKFLCMPSPARNKINSESRTRAIDDKPRLGVGAAADVPKNVKRMFTMPSLSLCCELNSCVDIDDKCRFSCLTLILLLYLHPLSDT